MADSHSLLERIASAAAGMDPGLTDADIVRLVEGARRKRRRRLVGRVGLGVLLGGAGILAGLRATAPTPVPIVARSPAQPAPALLRLHDGSTATPLDAASVLAVREDSPGRVALALDRGRARFEVAPRPGRPFEVQMGEVTVTVVGTVFTVDRVADRIGVSVERGTVRVDWKVGAQELHAGESGWFPPVQIRTPPAESGTEPAAAGSDRMQADAKGGTAEASERAARPQLGRSPIDKPGRRNSAMLAGLRADQPGQTLSRPRRGDSRPGLLEPSAVSPARAWSPSLAAREVSQGQVVRATTAEDLLAAADTARSAGRRSESVALLRRLLSQHRDDARAPLAAFTLGRILLMELAQPGEAALAFAEVRALAPAGPFAEDALAREAEAWNKAGDPGKAAERAREYLRLYPYGRRAGSLQGLTGIK
jgi:transmembrane sensor